MIQTHVLTCLVYDGIPRTTRYALRLDPFHHLSPRGRYCMTQHRLMTP